MKVAIIGQPDTILGFKALGIETLGCQKKEEVISNLEQIRENKDYAVVFITENWFSQIKEELKQFAALPLPAIVAIPDQSGSQGMGLENLKKIVERAIGSDILHIK